MKQEPSFITTLTIGDETREVKVYGNVDKITNFTYYTFYFDDSDMVQLSKFDSKEWRVDNAVSAERLLRTC